MVDFMNNYGSYDFYNKNQYNYFPMMSNPMFCTYGKYPNVQNDSLFGKTNDNTSFGNSYAAFTANAQSAEEEEEKKNSSKAWLIAGGLAILAAGILFRKNISKALGLGENVAKESKVVTENLSKNGEEAAASIKNNPSKDIADELTSNNKNNNNIENLREQWQSQNNTENIKTNKTNESINDNQTFQTIKEKDTSIQAKPMEFAPHNYNSEDIPSLNLTTRTFNNDYTAFEIKDGKTIWADSKKYHEPFNQLGMSEASDARKTILVIGKNTEGKKIVWLQAEADRYDAGGRSIRSMFVFDAPGGEKFTNVQLDLIKGIYGKSQEVLKAEAPLARSTKVLENLDKKYTRQVSLEIDQDIILREIAHWSKGKEMPQEVIEQLNKVDSLKNGEYIRLWG